MRIFRLLALAFLLAGCTLLRDVREPGESEFAQVRAGMTRDDTLRLLGKPLETMRFPLSGNESWGYLFQDTWGFMSEFSVTFDPQGAVIGTFARRLNDGGDLNP